MGKQRLGNRRSIRRTFGRMLVIVTGITAMAGAATAPAIAVPVAHSTLTAAAAGGDSAPLNLAVSPTRLALVATAQAAKTSQTISIRATGGNAGTITVELRDAVIDDAGGWRLTAAGSTTNGLQDVLRVVPASFVYDPVAGAREFRPDVALLPEALDQPRFGALVVTFVPAGSEGSGQVVVQGAVAIQVIAARSAAELDTTARLAGSAALRLDLDELSVRQDDPWTVVDGIVPNLPRITGHGPATIRVHGANRGNTVLDTQVVYRVYRRNPLGVLPFVHTKDTPSLVIRQRPRFLLGGQGFNEEVSTRQEAKGAAASDALPFIGLVRVEATLTGSIAGLRAAPVTRSRTFVVVPWAEVLVVGVAFVGWGRWREERRRRRNQARQNQAR